jgi:2-polyprenyl-3-methyl-5-hydroxy-6-metoxy-1,4-benzoquinol methylase
MTKKYYFQEVTKCEMCGDPSDEHKIMGLRLNQTQGLSPKKKTGIAVSVKKCTNCSLVYSSPQPIPFDIQDHYGIPPEEYWIPEEFNFSENYFSKEIKQAKQFLDFKSGMNALDVGAGLGKCMIALDKAGFEAYGMEPSNPFYKRAIDVMNINPDRLKLGAIEEVDYPANFFDFITYGAVFEHVYHPAQCLEKTLHWLKPGGIIHLEVPNSEWLLQRFINFYYKLRGTNYVTNLSPMHSPFHLYEFHLKSFRELGKKLGFEIENYEYQECYIYHFPKVLHPLVRKVMSWTNTGMQLSVYLRKK